MVITPLIISLPPPVARALDPGACRILGANFAPEFWAQIPRKNDAPRRSRAGHESSASFNAQTEHRKRDLRIGESFLRRHLYLQCLAPDYTVILLGGKGPEKIGDNFPCHAGGMWGHSQTVQGRALLAMETYTHGTCAY